MRDEKPRAEEVAAEACARVALAKLLKAAITACFRPEPECICFCKSKPVPGVTRYV